MRISQLILGCAVLVFASTGFAKQEKTLICHVGNEAGPGGETYLDDPNCVPSDANGFFCPDAGKIDLILVPKHAKHLGNDSHSWDGISDYEPGTVGASGDGTEDSDGDGVDDGCQPAELCPCWDEVDLLSVTAENNLDSTSCDTASNQVLTVIQNDEFDSSPSVEGGFAVFEDVNFTQCATRDFPPFLLDITTEEAGACRSQIVERCADIGHPITP